MINEKDRKIAYFSMEIGIDSRIHTYSGGLGILAGDTIRSCADLKVPIVCVTLLYEKGYFYQKLDEQGNQKEFPVQWSPRDTLKPLPKRVTVQIENRSVAIRAWQYDVRGITGYSVPIIFLDTDIEENSEFDRSINDFLYGGDQRYRLAQEIVLGIGGVRMFKELGYTGIKKYHMNEGHASLLTLELLSRMNGDSDAVRQLCIFTTHTPVPAGHDQFPYELVKSVLGDFISLETLKRYAGLDKLNMTLLALNLSKYINGVAKRHGEVSREMFPGYPIDSITNGIHSYTWSHPSFKGLYDRYIPGWAGDPFSLRYAISIPQEEIWQAHLEAKKELIDYVNKEANSGLDYETFTVGFARRATLYKRMDLVFSDINRLRSICEKRGKIQFIFSGKSHPQDWQGKELIRKVFEFSRQLKDKMKIVYLGNYDMDIAKALVSGVDLWLNTPKRPNEASGTSGMKAAHNGVPSLSVLDGWWIEGCIEGITGWSIGSKAVNDDQGDAEDLYRKLEEIISIFYKDRDSWAQVMRSAISFNASFFNTHRMVQQYGLNAYLD